MTDETARGLLRYERATFARRRSAPVFFGVGALGALFAFVFPDTIPWQNAALLGVFCALGGLAVIGEQKRIQQAHATLAKSESSDGSLTEPAD